MEPGGRGAGSDVSRAFGDALREFRSAAGLSQEALAERAGLDRTYVGGLERGQRNPTLKVLWSLAAPLEVSPSDLVREVEVRLGDAGEQG